MDTYRKCKVKRDVKAGELVDMTTVEVFGKPVHVPNYGYIRGGERPFVKTSEGAIMSSLRYGKTLATIMTCLEMQKCHVSFVLLAPDLKVLDRFIEAGIQPSNIRLPNEFASSVAEFTITPDGIVMPDECHDGMGWYYKDR